MNIIVITKPDFFSSEAEQIVRLFEGGLQILHLRKPDSSLADYERLIRKIPAEYHNRIVLHEHFQLLEKYALRGVHLNKRNPSAVVETGGAPSLPIHISKSCHTIDELQNIENFDYVFLSPIFDSISKVGYQSAFSDEVLQKACEDGLVNQKVIALGGVNYENMNSLKKYNFGAVAMLGAVWENVASSASATALFDVRALFPETREASSESFKAFPEARETFPEALEGKIKNFAFQFITHTNEKYNYLQSAELALAGGCRWIQLRMKDAPLHKVEETAIKLREMCRQFDATFIIDDHVELAKKVGADGVHIGKMDMPPEEARAILGNSFIIGGTANTFEDIKQLAAVGVDYIGLGPFRFTQTKKNLSAVLGLEGYEKIIKQCRAENINLPIVAIGGIKTDDIQAIMNTSVNGIAVSGNILNAENPIKESHDFKIQISKFQIY